MTTESRELFELCKQVYKATGWTGTNQVIGIYYQISEVDVKYGIFDRSEKRKEPVDTPLYTSDYLLEKLPFRTKYTRGDGRIAKGWCYLVLTYADNGQSVATYANRNKEWIEPFYSDTPLKALLKLCLALHKEGVL